MSPKGFLFFVLPPPSQLKNFLSLRKRCKSELHQLTQSADLDRIRLTTRRRSSSGGQPSSLGARMSSLRNRSPISYAFFAVSDLVICFFRIHFL